MLDAVAEQHPVREARELIVKRPMRELSLELLALAHVSHVHDDPANVGAIEQVGARCLDLECSERRQQLELERGRRAVVLSPIEGAGYPRTVVSTTSSRNMQPLSSSGELLRTFAVEGLA